MVNKAAYQVSVYFSPLSDFQLKTLHICYCHWNGVASKVIFKSWREYQWMES